MAEMVGSAVVQEVVSRGVSFVLGKREEKATQVLIMERLEMAVSHLELALERSAKLPITDVSLLKRRKMIKCVYFEAMDLLDENKHQALAAGQEQIAQGVKRWIIHANKNLPISSSAGLNTDEVQRFERFAEFAGRFVRDVESGCSLWHNTFFNPIVRHLLQGKILRYLEMKGDQLRDVIIRPTYYEERGIEAMLNYHYKDGTIMDEKSFYLVLVLRLSESTDIVGIAIKVLQLLTSQFNLAAESAMEELILLPTLLHDIAHLYAPSWLVGSEELFNILFARLCRQDPACCGASRQGLCSNNTVSSELSHMFPEEVIYLHFTSSRSSSYEAAGRSISSNGWTSPLAVSVAFMPHCDPYGAFTNRCATVLAGNVVVEKRRDASIQQMSKTLISDAINCFLRQPELPKYTIHWHSRHGMAWFEVEKPRIERTRRRHNTRGSTKPSTLR